MGYQIQVIELSTKAGTYVPVPDTKKTFQCDSVAACTKVLHSVLDNCEARARDCGADKDVKLQLSLDSDDLIGLESTKPFEHSYDARPPYDWETRLQVWITLDERATGDDREALLSALSMIPSVTGIAA